MKVKPMLVPIILIVAILGTVLAAQTASLWSTSGRTAVNVQQLAPADIKGWMTLQQVSDGFGMKQAELYDVIHVPANVSSETALKDLEAIVPGFQITSLRDAMTARLAAPSTLQSK